jgi:hypothetical protein
MLTVVTRVSIPSNDSPTRRQAFEDRITAKGGKDAYLVMGA